ncbi:MAG: hypothetical protein KF752_11805 [Pirellulaceae bacterium]|nr:hypothetical protein [Pirellulaceae bacterium]
MVQPKQIARANELANARRLHAVFVVANLYLEGKTKTEIADTLGIQIAAVNRCLNEARKAWLRRSTAKYQQHVATELARLDKVESEAWSAWRQSLRPSRSKSTTSGEHSSITKRQDSQSGDPRFLAVIQKCVEQRAKLLGLDSHSDEDKEQPKQILEVVISTREEYQHLPKLMPYAKLKSAIVLDPAESADQDAE